MDRAAPGHSRVVAEEARAAKAPSFDEVYDTCVGSVWRVLRRLGVPDADLEDAAQEVFIVAHQRIATFEGRSSLKSWICGIATFVARTHRRTIGRHPDRTGAGARSVEGLEISDQRPAPEEIVGEKQGLELLAQILDTLDDEKREVFVLARIEELSGPEIASALGIKSATVYSRLLAAEKNFERAVERHQLKERRLSQRGGPDRG